MKKNTLILPHSSAKSLFQCFREKVDSMVDVGEIVLRVAGRPWRHHEAFQRLGSQITTACLDEFADDIVRSRIDFTALPARPVRSAWNLFKAHLFKIIETFETLVVGRLVFL